MTISTFKLYHHIFVLTVHISKAFTFSRKLTGIDFRPFVHGDDIEFRPAFNSYTDENVRTMLEVASTKFSRIMPHSVNAFDVRYEKNVTYYYFAGVRARTAEIAAQINRERNNLALTVWIGIWQDEDESDRKGNTELNVALEASEKANAIFPGTVQGFFTSYYNLTSIEWATKTLSMVSALRNYTLMHPGLRVGTRQTCKFSEHELNLKDSNSNNIFKKTKEIVLKSDFIICELSPQGRSLKHGPRQSLNRFRKTLLRDRFAIRSINNNIEVMWYTYWQKPVTNNSRADIEEFQLYWYEANQFAMKNNYSVWLDGAFRTSRGASVYGWWKLPRHDLINDASGYLETISELEESTLKDQDDSNIEASSIYAVVISGIIGSLIMVGLIYMLYQKLSKPEITILTMQDIKEFRGGVLASKGFKEIDDKKDIHMVAIRQPYDYLLEIPKEKLEISYDQILGGGEFGCVFKALIRQEPDREIEVALKMIKPNGGATALKGLLSEIKILSYLGNHPNLVPIAGAYTAELHKGIAYLATELCCMGTLRNCLKTIQDNIKQTPTFPTNDLLPLNDLLRWSYEIACGMEYLEQKGVIHADLATRNVLLSSECVARIADFGLSRRLYEYTNYTKTQQEPLPWRWMAVESLKMSEFSTKSDVWSYGVTLWEIFALGAQPYPGLPWSLEFAETLEDGFRLTIPKYATPKIFEIMEKCWVLDKNERPSFSHIRFLVRHMRVNDTEGPYTTLYSSS